MDDAAAEALGIVPSLVLNMSGVLLIGVYANVKNRIRIMILIIA